MASAKDFVRILLIIAEWASAMLRSYLGYKRR